MNNQISILGCGWLGLPLAQSLLKKGFKVNGSTTSLDKVSILQKEGIKSFYIEVFKNKIEGEIEEFLLNSEILIIDIPPKLRGNSTENFVQKITTLLPFIEKSLIKKVLFVSSTSVYNDSFFIDEVDEKNKPQPESESGKQLLKSEEILMNNTNFKTTIIRFGGLIGKDRHPIKFLAGRKNIENPDAPINLIHQVDCIGIIEAIIKKGLRQAQSDIWDWNEVFNAVAPFHPTRKEYYNQKAIELNLPLPEFYESKPSVGKLILSKKIEEVLRYKFQNTSL